MHCKVIFFIQTSFYGIGVSQLPFSNFPHDDCRHSTHRKNLLCQFLSPKISGKTNFVATITYASQYAPFFRNAIVNWISKTISQSSMISHDGYPRASLPIFSEYTFATVAVLLIVYCRRIRLMKFQVCIQIWIIDGFEPILCNYQFCG